MKKGLVVTVLLVILTALPALAQIDEFQGRDPFDLASDMALLLGKVETDDESELAIKFRFETLHIVRSYIRRWHSISNAVVVIIMDQGSNVFVTRFDTQDGRAYYLDKPKQPGGEMDWQGVGKSRVDEGTARFVAAAILRKYLGAVKKDSM